MRLIVYAYDTVRLVSVEAVCFIFSWEAISRQNFPQDLQLFEDIQHKWFLLSHLPLLNHSFCLSQKNSYNTFQTISNSPSPIP